MDFENLQAEDESHEGDIDALIETEQQTLISGVQKLLDKTEQVANSEQIENTSPELMKEIEAEAGEVKEGVLSLSERGFITPEFAARLVPLAAMFSLFSHPQILDSLQRNVSTGTAVATIGAGIWAILSVGRNAMKLNSAKWHNPDKGYDFFEFNLDELKSRWGIEEK